MPNEESRVLVALFYGLISAASLPLGAIVSKFWRPGGRVLAILMAFGGGALLAALTLDLVDSALDKGELPGLTIGCVVGGILFFFLNQVVNNHGGFLRKTSTTLLQLDYLRRRRFKELAPRLRNLSIFAELPEGDLQMIADHLQFREIPAGRWLYQRGDPAERLYLIDSGKVKLLDPDEGMTELRQQKVGDAFGRMGFLTGAAHATVAETQTECRFWILDATGFAQCLQASSLLAAAYADFIQSEEPRRYLVERHRFTEEEVDHWCREAQKAILDHRELPTGGPSVMRAKEKFKTAAHEIRRAPLFDDLPDEVLDQVGERLFLKKYEKGHAFFHQGDWAGRLYIIEEGEVSLIDPSRPEKEVWKLGPSDAFGAKAFVTRSQHSVTAVATEETTVWILRWRDVRALLRSSPQWRQAVRRYVQSDEIEEYLEAKQALSQEEALDWSRKATRMMEKGQPVPTAGHTVHGGGHGGAPLAIWLGIFLDGIPESFVIGANVVHHATVSLSLIVGLFLANFPEALSSSVGMQRQGMGFGKVFLMWFSLMIMTGVGAAIGSAFFMGVSHSTVAFVEGVAAGAMLTMIAETMLPEAYQRGGSVVGLSTLGGFLAAILSKALG